MKKFFVLLGTLAAAALLFSCANNSNDNLSSSGTTSTPTAETETSGTGTDSGNGGGTENGGGQTAENENAQLPPGVGTNELAGKTFTDMMLNQKFEADTYTWTSQMSSNPATEYNSAYNMEMTWTYSYTCDSNSKVFYSKLQKFENVYIRNGVKLDMPKTEFSTDAEFIEWQKKWYKKLYDLATDDYIESQAKQSRYAKFMSYGYTDTSGQTPVSNEIIANYNYSEELPKLINAQSYSVSDTGIKIVDDCRYPAAKDFCEIFNHFDCSNSTLFLWYWQIKDSSDNIAYGLYNGGTSANASLFSINASPFRLPEVSLFPYSHIMKSDGLLVYKISSVDANGIHTSATGTRADTTSDFSFTNESKTFKYTTAKSQNYAIVDIEGLGKINVVYATPATIPDFSTAPEYTLQ